MSEGKKLSEHLAALPTYSKAAEAENYNFLLSNITGVMAKVEPNKIVMMDGYTGDLDAITSKAPIRFFSLGGVIENGPLSSGAMGAAVLMHCYYSGQPRQQVVLTYFSPGMYMRTYSGTDKKWSAWHKIWSL